MDVTRGSCIFLVVVANVLSSGGALVGDALFTGDSGFGRLEGESGFLEPWLFCFLLGEMYPGLPKLGPRWAVVFILAAVDLPSPSPELSWRNF